MFRPKKDNLYGAAVAGWRKREVLQMWIEILLFVFLGICAAYDGVQKQIPLVVVWLGIIAAIVLYIQGLGGNQTWQAVVLSVIPGVAFWIFSFITGEKVGYGDGWILIMIGLFMGLWKCFLILMTGLTVSSFVALILLAVKRVSKNYQLPFVPFLLLGMGVVVCL